MFSNAYIHVLQLVEQSVMAERDMVLREFKTLRNPF